MPNIYVMWWDSLKEGVLCGLVNIYFLCSYSSFFPSILFYKLSYKLFLGGPLLPSSMQSIISLAIWSPDK